MSDEITCLNLPESTINNVHLKFKNAFESLLHVLDEYVGGNMTDSSKVMSDHCRNFASYVSNEIGRYCTSYKRKKVISGNFYVHPVRKNLGDRWDKVYNSSSNSYFSVLKQCTFQYISILQTIESLFQNDSFKTLFFSPSHTCDDQTIKNFCCTKNFNQNKFFQENKNAIQIHIIMTTLR